MAEYERVLLPFAKWAPDAPMLADDGRLDEANGMIYHDGIWQFVQAKGTIASINGSNPEPSAAIGWSDESGVNRAALGALGHLYAVDLQAGTLTDRCKGGHYSSAHWDLVKFGASVIATNGTDAVQLFNFSGASSDLITSTTKPRGKFVCASRGHVILAYITSPAANARQFRWSALNNAQDWEPGSNRSGFGELPGDAGVITGVAGFEDFFLIFSSTGLYRASYIGGADVWRLQQIGSYHDALPLLFEETIIQIGREAFYLSRTGPKVVVNGEQALDLGVGEIRRFLMDDIRAASNADWNGDSTIPFGSRAWGTHDGFRGLIYWGWQAEGQEGDQNLLVYAYSIGDQAWSFFVPDTLQWSAANAKFGALFPRTGNLSSLGAGLNPGWGLCWAHAENTGSQTFLRVLGLSGSGYHNGWLGRKLWRPGHPKTQLHAVRPVFQSQGTGAVPSLQVVVNSGAPGGTPPGFSVSTGSTAEDSDGWLWPASGALVGGQFEFQISFVATGKLLRDFAGLEVLVTGGKSARGGAP